MAKTATFQNPIFQDEAKAREALEAVRWPDGPYCPHCGKTVQADETYYGNPSKRAKHYRKGHSHKASIVALVEPKGRVRAFHVQKANAATVREVLVTNVHRTTELHTDESKLYWKVGEEF